MLVLSRKSRESVVVGGADGFHRLLKVTVLGIQRHERETGLRGRCRCTCPSFGGVGTNPSRRSEQEAEQQPRVGETGDGGWMTAAGRAKKVTVDKKHTTITEGAGKSGIASKTSWSVKTKN